MTESVRRMVVGISSSALFDTRTEHSLYLDSNLETYVDYQVAHEEEPFPKGTAFPLVDALLRLNTLLPDEKKIEVVVLSQNEPEAGLRVMNSIDYYKLPMTRAAFTGGEPVAKYCKPLKVSLFLSRNEQDVRDALRQKVAAGLIYDPPDVVDVDMTQLRIAFDGDAVLFSDASEQIAQTQGLDAFRRHEVLNASDPLPAGPFEPLLRLLASLRDEDTVRKAAIPPVEVALVTARDSPAHKRVILTLRSWGIRVDQIFFLGGLPKDPILKAFRPQIFFEDQEKYGQPASRVVPSARVLPEQLTVPQPVREEAESTRTEDEPARIPVPSPIGSASRAYTGSRLTKRAYEARCREILSFYTPFQGGRKRLDSRFREFIRQTASLPLSDRQRVLSKLERFDLSGTLAGYALTLNRELGDVVERKLRELVSGSGEQKTIDLQ